MDLRLPQPDPLPVREALRVLRHGLRRGRKVLREVVPVEALPDPAAQLAGSVLRRLDDLAGEVDVATTEMARRLLSERRAAPALRELGADEGSAAAFAAAMYATLRAVLWRLGDSDAFISEALLRRAYADGAAAAPELWRDRPAEAAADAALWLLDASVVRGAEPGPGTRLARGQVVTVAVFAALLWLLSDRSEDDADATLASAADLAVVLADEVAVAAAARDRRGLAALFARFAPHV